MKGLRALYSADTTFLRIATKLPQVMLLMFAMSLPFQIVLAKPPTHRIRIPVSKMQEPIFDTSLVPKPQIFKLKIKTTQFLRPADPSIVLHGHNKVVDLSAEETRDVLRGRVAEEQRESIINTREYGVKPRFYVDLRKLEGKYAADIEHQMEAEIEDAQKKLAGRVEREEKQMERELHARQPIPDLPILPAHANASPDAAKALEAELAREQQDPRHRMPPLDALLANAQNKGKKMPALPDRQPVMPQNDRVAQPGTAVPSIPKTDTSAAERQMAEKLGRNNPQIPQTSAGNRASLPERAMPPASIPSIPSIASVASIPSVASVAAIPSVPKSDTSRAEREMAEKLVRAKLQIPTIPAKNPARPERAIPSVASKLSVPKTDTSAPEQLAEALVKAKLQVPADLDVSAELLRARKKAQAVVGQAAPAMNSIMTQLRRIPSRAIPSGSKADESVEAEIQSSIQWDAWHARFADLAREPILKAVSKAGNPSGANTVEITVLPNHHVSAQLAQPGKNSDFDQAILQAYLSLDANPALEYPAGSRRSAVTFLIDNKHAETGAPSTVKSQTSVGDKEVLRFHR